MNDIIAKVNEIKELWALRDAGITIKEASEKLGITFSAAAHVMESKKRALYAYNFYQVKSLSGQKLTDAINRYLDAEPISKIIDGVKLIQLGSDYFVALHVEQKYPDHKKIRARAYQRRVRGNCQPDEKLKNAQLEMTTTLKEAKNTQTKDFGLFEDDPRIKRAPVISFHGKSSGSGYSCAANMCAEA